MRILRSVAVLIVVGFAGLTLAGDPQHEPAAPSVEGTWSVSLTYYYEGTESGPSDNLQYLQQFHADGRTVIYLPQVEGQRFDETRTACAGEWKRRSRHAFDVTLYCTWAEMWTDAPIVPDRILIKVTMHPKGQRWTATPFYYQPWVNGEYFVSEGWGDMKGVRLGITPLP
jgi:hypothetical protein